MKNKTLLFLLGLLFLVPLSLRAYDFESDGLYYKITSKTEPYTVEVTDTYFNAYKHQSTITIPSGVFYQGNYYRVTGISEYTFYDCTALTSVTIGKSVTSIGETAFGSCTALTSITIPDGVTSIGSCAFSSCTSLTSIIVENGNSVYDSRNNCNAIIETATNTLIIGCQNTIIPNSVTSIGDDAFVRCSSLTSITIPDGVTSIGNRAFAGCSGLSVTIPHSVTSIGSWAFENVLNIVYNGSATGSPWGAKATNGYVEGDLVYDSAAKTKVIACNSNVSGEVIIPEGVTSIGDDAFSGCSSLSSIVFPSTITKIGSEAFYNCDKLFTIYCWAVEPPQCNGNPFRRSDSFFACVPLYVPKQSIETYTVVSPWNEIAHCHTADYYIYPIGIVNDQVIGDFHYNLDTLNITASLVKCDNKEIREVIIPDNIRWQGQTYPVTEIGSDAFYMHSEIENVKMGANVQAISSSAFASSSITSIVFNEGLKYIGSSCFYECQQLNSLRIPDSVESIGSSVCYRCYFLTSVSLGSGLKKIGSHAFCRCSRLATLQIPDGVTEIPPHLCQSCTQLRTVSMGNVTAIGECAFTACNNLMSINVKAQEPPVCASYAFSGDESGDNVSYDAVITVPCYTSDAYKSALHWNQFYNYQEQYFYFDAVSEDNEKGLVFITQKPTCNEPVAEIKAVPKSGYQFKEWSDGNTEDPRTLIAEMEMKLIAHFQSPTAIDNTEAENAVEAQKIISDGQVLILRNGKAYNMLGQETR